MTTRIFAWNPRPFIFNGRLRKVLPLKRKNHVNNFGDLLGPLIVSGLLKARGMGDRVAAGRDLTLFSIGSVLHFARTGDVVWGTGVNGKVEPGAHTFTDLDVRAVRGPLTRSFLLERGIDCPPVYGDPGLLVPKVMPHLVELAGDKKYALTVIPNLNDLPSYEASDSLVSPILPVEAVLERIAQSELVVGSSLHAIIVAEALGVPARLVATSRESPFKYEDYYRGSGRTEFEMAATVADAVRLGGEQPLDFDPDPLMQAFPYDLWE
ncbi:hypothetical protein B7R22_02855 [Subtercola boreus]|uniref:Polysaccharide pyruvyl transferase domain-containing protein n=1 Tax=Subtercola boreus TaxID=120213 RepID=A0A3E0W2C6_9MICO|nr:polysaccharide pyruvyl transferase family protein [Subtercola boreus]RFA16442.1 hypothetical protein B7R22_02855 [Subtercola boreus]